MNKLGISCTLVRKIKFFYSRLFKIKNSLKIKLYRSLLT